MSSRSNETKGRFSAAVLAAAVTVSAAGCDAPPTAPEVEPGPFTIYAAKPDKPGGGGKGGGDSSTGPVFVFRDSGGDGLTSDGSAYVSGSSGVDASLGTGFVLSFGRRSNHSVQMDFSQTLAAGTLSVPGFLADGSEKPASLHVYRDDGQGNNEPLESMAAGQVSEARLSIYFDDPDDRKAEWILSMAQKQAEPFWFGSVECLDTADGSCRAWRVAPGADERLRLLRNVSESAGEYSMPFEAAFCLMDEDACRAAAGY